MKQIGPRCYHSRIIQTCWITSLPLPCCTSHSEESNPCLVDCLFTKVLWWGVRLLGIPFHALYIWKPIRGLAAPQRVLMVQILLTAHRPTFVFKVSISLDREGTHGLFIDMDEHTAFFFLDCCLASHESDGEACELAADLTTPAVSVPRDCLPWLRSQVLVMWWSVMVVLKAGLLADYPSFSGLLQIHNYLASLSALWSTHIF